MTTRYYSIRMHADRDAYHLSGAERLVPSGQVEAAAAVLLGRGLASDPSALSLRIDEVEAEAIVYGPLPDLVQMPEGDVTAGRRLALASLVEAGVAAAAARSALQAISDGTPLRGAMLVDAVSGMRLEPDARRGVRATRFDLTDTAAAALDALLAGHGLTHSRTREALALAAKVLAAPGIVAELCWSDAIDYTAGYVAAPGFGYRRFPHLKAAGDPCGGRAFFLRPDCDPAETIVWLQQTPFLADRVGSVSRWRDG